MQQINILPRPKPNPNLKLSNQRIWLVYCLRFLFASDPESRKLGQSIILKLHSHATVLNKMITKILHRDT